jgi:hypothetical protein
MTDGIALVWIHGEPVLMRSLLVANGLDLEGWTLTWVRGISDDGRTFTGEGINPSGQREGWVAHLAPEPGAGLLLGCALLALVVRQALEGKNRPASRGEPGGSRRW